MKETPIRATSAGNPKARKKARAWWLKQLHTWHWISAAVSLVGMLLFAVTGLTLNHAASIGAKPVVAQHETTVPTPLLPLLRSPRAANAPLPDPVAASLLTSIGIDAHGKAGEWTDAEVYVALPRPGGDGWVSIDRASGKVTSEVTDRGWISYLNDLHKGRNAGAAWFWFIDMFAVACMLFTLTGLVLLQLHARHRPLTWPLAALGLVIPVIIALFFIH